MYISNDNVEHPVIPLSYNRVLPAPEAYMCCISNHKPLFLPPDT